MRLWTPKLKLYLDTTIPNYVFAVDNPERMVVTQRFLQTGRLRYEMVISDVVMSELEATGEPKKSHLIEEVHGLPVLPLTEEAELLARAYIQGRIFPARSFNDARHVALATLNRVDALVSWNFKDLVNLRKTKAINLLHGGLNLPHLEIVTPEEALV